VDDFSHGKNRNYLLEHSDARIQIYERENFPYSVYNVDLIKTAV